MSLIILIIWILTILSLIEGQLLPEDSVNRITACEGETLRGSCPANNVIAVKDIKYGTTNCALSANDPECCDYESTDCLTDYTGTAQQAACSGRGLCTDVTIGEADTSSCGSPYPELNHYITMEFYCIPESRIRNLCDESVSLTATGSPLYTWNNDYPTGPIRAAATNCSCSVEVSSCNSQIKVYFVHFELSDGGGSCSENQNIQIDDKGTIHTYTCSQNNNYEITTKMTSSSNYIIVTLDNAAAIGDGKFWMGFEATNDKVPLTVHCPAEEQQMCMDCPQLNIISNGTVSTVDGLSTGKTAKYSCEPEFDLLGNKTRICLENGQWSGQAPTCRIKVCSPLPDPEHGNVMATGESVGQTASYECDSGYSLNGTVSRICQANRTWSGIQPTCVLIECPILNNPPNGIVSIDGGSTVGKNATYKCNYGYKLEGVESRTCQTNKTWAGEEPVCAEIEACPALTSPENGQVSTDGNRIGSTATYTCSHGFIISNSNARVCQAGFTWNGTQPTCTKRKLGDPCTSESDCSDAIPESTCTNEICGCPEGSEIKNNVCVRSGESKPGGDGEMPIWGWILIGLGGVIVLTTIAVICFLQRRKDRQPKDDLDRCKMESENTNNMIKDKSNAFDNNAYQGHVDQTRLTERPPIKTSDEMINEVGGTDENTIQKQKSEHCSSGKIEHPVDRNPEQVMVVDNTIHDGEAVEKFIYVPHQPTEPPDQDQAGLFTNKKVQEEANSGLSNIDTENAEDSRNPKKTEELVIKTTIEPPVDKDFVSVMMCEHPKNDYKDDQEFNSNPQTHKESTGEEQNKFPEHEKTEELVNKTTIEPPEDKDFESVLMCENPKNDYKDDQEFNSIPQKHKESTGEEQNKLPEHETIQDQNSSNDVLKHPEAANKDSIEAAEKEIKNAVKLDERFSEASKLITDVTSALFRSASKAKKDLVEKACITGFTFDTTEDGEWSKGLISAAKSVLAAIFSMCSIANEMVDGKASEEKMHAATKEVKRATNALVLSYHVEGYPESDSLQKLQTACDVVNKAAESLLASASLKSDTQPAKKRSIALDDNEVQKAMKRIEAQETVMRKQKELEEAQKAKALINEEQNRFQQETTAL